MNFAPMLLLRKFDNVNTLRVPTLIFMKKTFYYPLIVLLTIACSQARAASYIYHADSAAIHNGSITEKIWLDNYAVPTISFSNTAYTDVATLPTGVKPADATQYTITLGMDRKRPFAVIHIPAYKNNTSGNYSRISDLTINVTEDAATPGALAKTTQTTTATNSVLNSGTFYKIAVPATGFYKIDYSFLQKMGITPANINTADIRLFGNGGNMLSENNAVPRITDLAENAIWVNDGGDGKFDQNDFVVFYATGPTQWTANLTTGLFTHQNNLYADSAYYFLTFSNGAGLRIGGQGTAPTPNVNVTSFNDYAVHDVDLYNPGLLGKEWYGEQFNQNTSQNFVFNFGTTVDAIKATIYVANVSTVSGNQFVTKLNGQQIGASVFGANGGSDDPIFESPEVYSGVLNSNTATFNITYTPQDYASIGYLNYIELNVRRSLGISGTQQNFRDLSSVAQGNVAKYVLQGANGGTQVWDVTNPQVPVLMNGSFDGSNYNFSREAATLHEFAAFNNTSFATPAYSGPVANQNLHGLDQVDMIIVTYPNFIDAANQLADFHRTADGYRVVVATTTQVYNEFSSGGQDLSAIRDFAKMFYDRAGSDPKQLPRYLLLLGGASYDYKNRVPNNSNFVPTFESAYSHSITDSYCSDDFFSFLDGNEYIENTKIVNAMDIGVGRLPVRNASDALAVVNKIKAYKSTKSLGAWRLAATFAADRNDDAGAHMDDAEAMANNIEMNSVNLYNETKVYLDAMNVTPTPAGDRCPDANAVIDNQVFKGNFLMNYNGHGNPEVWSSRRILTSDDYNKWNNLYMLPFMVTATCDFGQFDQPATVSAAEQLVVRNNGGVIAAITTTKAVYATPNHELNIQYLTAQFEKFVDLHWNTFGDAFRIGKNVNYAFDTADAFTLANYRKFTLLGDPALQPDFPKYAMRVDSIVDVATQTPTTTVSALGSYQLYGSVTDASNNILNDFNGTASVSFFDKPTKVRTISGTNELFSIQDNVIYRGKATVTNGHYSMAFISPKDINYTMGAGKISCYAENGVTDAAGSDSSYVVGGFSDHPVSSTTPPIVKPYIGDSLFINGGITGPNTVLFVSLFDRTGINVSGTNVGHDLIGILDGDAANPYILNDYYQTITNSYQQGYVTYSISGLSVGKHSITVRAWDVNDNYSEGTVNFVVVNGNEVAVQDLYSYPNPFKDVTHFIFEHNQPGEQLNVTLAIYNTAGVEVKQYEQSFTATNSRSNQIDWDGTDNNNVKLPSGVYICRIQIATAAGLKTTAYQKAVLVR